MAHDLMSVQAVATKPGYIYIYLSNEGDKVVDVYYDDMSITHKHSPIVAGSDYCPFGLPMEGRQITQEDWRYGYQGAFAEQDEETGYTAFELRMYDARFGRWASTDPYGQYWSPYLGMGNNPVSYIDADGGWTGWWVIGGAVVGGVIGGLADKENPRKGALIGMAIGAGVGFGASQVNWSGLMGGSLNINPEGLAPAANLTLVPVVRYTML